MKRFKISLAAIAIVVGIGSAFAFKTPVKTLKDDEVVWSRVGTSMNPNDNTWVEGSLPGGCTEADDICKAGFAEGYDPNTHSYATNATNADVIADDGFATAP